MKKRVVLLLLGLLLLCAVPALPEMTCDPGHVFIYNGNWYCNPGEGTNGCLRCQEEIVVTP